MEVVILMKSDKKKERLALVAFVLLSVSIGLVVGGCQNAATERTIPQNYTRSQEIADLQVELNRIRKNNADLKRKIEQCRSAKEGIGKRERDFYIERSDMLNDFGDVLRVGTPRILVRPMPFRGEGLETANRFLKVWDHVDNGHNNSVALKPFSELTELPLNSGTLGYWLISDADANPFEFYFEASAIEILIRGRELDRIGIASLDIDHNGKCRIGTQMVYQLNAKGIRPDWQETPQNGVFLLKLDFRKAFGAFPLKAGQRWGLLLPSGIGSTLTPPHIPCDFLGTGDVRIAEFEKLKDNAEVHWKTISGKERSQDYLYGQRPNDDSRRREERCRASLKPSITFGLYGNLVKKTLEANRQ